MSGKRSSQQSPSPSGRSGRRSSSGPWLRPTVEFLLRTGLFYALIYLCWLPFRDLYVEFLAAVSERIFRLVDHPPLITSLAARGDEIDYFSFTTGFDRPMGAVSFANLHVYLVTALALVLGVAWRDRLRRLRLVLLTLGLFVLLSLAICVVTIKTNADAQALAGSGIALLTSGERAFFAWAKRMLLMVGMLVFPTYLFFVAYVSRWQGPAAQADSSWSRRGRIRLAAGLAAGLLVVGSALTWWTRPQRDPLAYLDGWTKILELNPSSAAAKVNAALHLQQQQRLDEAIALYRDALQIDPELSGAHYNLGNSLQAKGRHREAMQHYEQVLLREPDHAAALRNLGLSLDALGRPCDALRYLEQSVLMQPAYAKERPFAERLTHHREVCRNRQTVEQEKETETIR